MKKLSSLRIVTVVISLALLLSCNGDNGNTIFVLPSVVTQGAPGPCATMDNQNFFLAFVTLAPGDAEPAFQATSSNTTNVTVSPTPQKTNRTTGGNGFEAQFAFSCNTRGSEADITVTDPANRFLPDSLRVVCLKALTLGRFGADGLASLEPGRTTTVDVRIDPNAEGVALRSILSPDSAGKFQITPGVNTTNITGRAQFSATCSVLGATGSVDFVVQNPTDNPNVQALRCPLKCGREE